MNEKHDLLSDYQDKRIQITGVFDRFSFVTKDYREIKTALLQDVYAHIDGKDVDIGHVWLQNADPLKPLGLTFGDGPATPAKLIFEVRRLARMAGGLDTLRELVDALRSES